MPVDFQVLFNVAISLLGAIAGWVLNTIWGAVKDMQKADKELAQKVSGVEILVAGSYVTRAEHSASMSRIEAGLQRIEDKLDGKVDKRQARP